MEGLTRNLDVALAQRDPRMDMLQLNGKTVDAGEGAAALVADLDGSLPYKREPIMLHLGHAVRTARDGSGAC